MAERSCYPFITKNLSFIFAVIFVLMFWCLQAFSDEYSHNINSNKSEQIARNKNQESTFSIIKNSTNKNNNESVKNSQKEPEHRPFENIFDKNEITNPKINMGANEIINKIEDLKQLNVDIYLRNRLKEYMNQHVVEKSKQEFSRILSQWGNINLDYQVNQAFELLSYKLLYLLPLYENQNYIFFTQLGYNFAANEQNFFSFGLALRSLFSQLIGANIFFDYDLITKHARASIGIEGATNDIALKANYYHPLTNWQTTNKKDALGYEIIARPASGFDIALKGFFPYERTLSGEISFNKWFGYTTKHWNNAHFYESSALKFNKYTLGTSLLWKPIPLFEAVISYPPFAEKSMRQFGAHINLNWEIDESPKHQVSRTAALNKASAAGTKRDFVKRNDYMIMEYSLITQPVIAKKIDLKPSVALLNGYYTSQLNDRVILEIIPYNHNNRTIVDVTKNLKVEIENNKNIVRFTDISQTKTPGVYSTVYTCDQIGDDNITVSYYDVSHKIPIRIRPKSVSLEVIPVIQTNFAGAYESQQYQTIEVRVIPYGPDGKAVSGIESELTIEEDPPNNFIIINGPLLEIGDSGVYKTSYTGDLVGTGGIKATHVLVEDTVNFSILSQIKNIEIRPNVLKNTANEFEIVRDETITLDLIPYDQYNNKVVGLDPLGWQITPSNASLTCNTGNIQETPTGSGIYKTTCTGTTIMPISVEVSYGSLKNTINTQVISNVHHIKATAVAALDTRGRYQTLVGNTVNLQIIPYNKLGAPISAIAGELSLAYTGTQGAVTPDSAGIIEQGGNGIYTSTYTSAQEDVGSIVVSCKDSTITGSFDVKIIDVASVELKPETYFDSANYLSTLNEVITLQITPLTATGYAIPNVVTTDFLLEFDASQNVNFSNNIVPTSIPGIYEATYEGTVKESGNIIIKYKGGRQAIGSVPISVADIYP